MQPLQWLDKNPPAEGRARQVFLLTDGEISNVDQVLNLCRTMATSTRIFSFGLGRSPSRSLVKGLARATNGRFVFIPPDASVDVYVGEQLQKALQPCITNVQVQWHLGAAESTSVPTKTPPVYVNDRLIVYALTEDKSIHFDENSRVELKTEQHQLGKAQVTHIPSIGNNAMIARLAAKALILELQHSKLPSSQKKSIGSLQSRFQEQKQTASSKDEDETAQETNKKRIIQLSLQYNILSPHTAFVGIEKRANGDNADMVLREVPIQISADDQHLQVDPFGFSNFASINYPMAIPTSAMCSIESCCDFEEQLEVPSYTPYYDLYMAEMDDAMACAESDDDSDDCIPTSEGFAIKENIMTENVVNNDNQDANSWPTNDQDIVRYLIDKQKFDGSWDLDPITIERLTGKPLTAFRNSTPSQLLVSAIVITILEMRFTSLSSMWHGIVQKARKHLFQLLVNDNKKLENLLEEIRKQI